MDEEKTRNIPDDGLIETTDRKVSGGFHEFHGWKIVRQFPAAGGEADVFLVERSGERRILKLYRYGIVPKPEVFQAVSSLGRKYPDSFVLIEDHGFDEGSGCCFEIDEYCPEGTLGDLLATRKLSEPEISSILTRLVEALERLHEHGIIHLDVKPANFLIRKREPLETVLADFGLSSIYDAGLSQKFTQAKGTSLYQAPENIVGALDPKSDWWSLGIVLMEVLAGRNPFEGLQNQVILYQLTTQGVEIPREIEPRWHDLLKGLLTRNPEKRWGPDEIRRWRDGREVPTFYDEEMATRKERTSAPESAQPAPFKRIATPFQFEKASYNTLEELLSAFSSSPPLWEAGKAEIGRGALVSWLEEGGRPQSASRMREIMQETRDPDRLLFKSLLVFHPSLPLSWLGSPVTEDRLVSALRHAREWLVPGPDITLTEGLFSGEIFQEYQKLTGSGLGPLERWLKLSRSMQGNPLGDRPLAFKADLLIQAMGDAFTAPRAIDLLAMALRGENPDSERYLSLLRERGFEDFAWKNHLWQPGDNLVWSFVAKALPHAGRFRGAKIPEPFTNKGLLISAIRRDSGLADLLGRIFASTDHDLGLAKSIQVFGQNHPWIEDFVRDLFGIHPSEKLEAGLSRARVRQFIDSRWGRLIDGFLLPPLLKHIREGLLVSNQQLKIARVIAENPRSLPEKTDQVKTWDEMMAQISTPGSPPDTQEYFDEIFGSHRLLLAKLSRRWYQLTLSEWLIICMIVGVLAAIAVPNFQRPGRGGSREMACYANMRVLLGAVEMYNYDHDRGMDRVGTDEIARLVQNQYLKSPLISYDPGCSYSSEGDLTTSGRIVCPVHGTAQGPGEDPPNGFRR